MGKKVDKRNEKSPSEEKKVEQNSENPLSEEKKVEQKSGKPPSEKGNKSHTFDPHKQPCGVKEDVKIEEDKCHESFREWNDQKDTAKKGDVDPQKGPATEPPPVQGSPSEEGSKSSKTKPTPGKVAPSEEKGKSSHSKPTPGEVAHSEEKGKHSHSKPTPGKIAPSEEKGKHSHYKPTPGKFAPSEEKGKHSHYKPTPGKFAPSEEKGKHSHSKPTPGKVAHSEEKGKHSHSKPTPGKVAPSEEKGKHSHSKPTPGKVAPSKDQSKPSKPVKTSQAGILDPSYVFTKWSTAATKMSETVSERYLQAQQKCEKSLSISRDVCRNSGKNAMSIILSPTGRQLAGKWRPSTAVYLATTALFTAYVTGWNPLLRYVSGNRSNIVEEGARKS